MGKVLPKGRNIKTTKEGESNKIYMRKMFDAEKKELTCKFLKVNIPKFGYDSYPGWYKRDQITLEL
jgi:hypothetical protein